MTPQEVSNLRLDRIYKFLMYYGDSKTGIIQGTIDMYFFTDAKDINAFNEEKTSGNRYREPIDISSISSFEEIIERQFRFSEPSVKNNNYHINISKLIILGAGASAGFSSLDNITFPKRPPLTMELFADDYEKYLDDYPGARQLSSLTTGNENLEVFFQKKWESVKKHYNPDLLYKIINLNIIYNIYLVI